MTGVLKSVDQYALLFFFFAEQDWKGPNRFLNIRLDTIKVHDEARHPHMVSVSPEGLRRVAHVSQMAVKNCFIRGSVVRYVQLPAKAMDTNLLEDATRRGECLGSPCRSTHMAPPFFQRLKLKGNDDATSSILVYGVKHVLWRGSHLPPSSASLPFRLGIHIRHTGGTCPSSDKSLWQMAH